MEILYKNQATDARDHYVFIFGLGMIGCAIRNSLLLHGYRPYKKIEINWDSIDAFKNAELIR